MRTSRAVAVLISFAFIGILSGAARITPAPPGETAVGVYPIVLPQVLTAARLTFQDQLIRLTRKDWYSNWVALDGVYGDGTPVRIKGEDLGELRSRVVFTVGIDRSEYDKQRVRALKEAFEAHILIATDP